MIVGLTADQAVGVAVTRVGRLATHLRGFAGSPLADPGLGIGAEVPDAAPRYRGPPHADRHVGAAYST